MPMSQALTMLHSTPLPTSITRSQLAPSHGKSSSPSVDFHTSSLACQKASISVQRRNIINFAITGAVLGLNMGDKNAWAAARRPPPQPPQDQEKKDPNISGVLAKVLASKKRKEAMKQAIAEQRAKGKPVQQE